MIVIKEIPSFLTLSRRARKFEPYAINPEILFLESMNEYTASDSFLNTPCKYSNTSR